jgi:hypothetical protein
MLKTERDELRQRQDFIDRVNGGRHDGQTPRMHSPNDAYIFWLLHA